MARKPTKSASPFKVPFLVAKQLAGGRWAYYWQPSATLKAAGWKSLSLPDTLEAAITAAKDRNEEVARWKAGGAKPQKVKPFIIRTSIASLIEKYKASEKFTGNAASTQTTYASALNLIERWATDPKAPGGSGNLPITSITEDRVAKLRDALMTPDENGHVRHHNAHNILRVLRILMAYAVKPLKLIEKNPAQAFELSTPKPRDQVWENEDIEALKSAAIKLGYPSIAFAMDLAVYTGQRPADVRSFTALPPPSRASHWREVLNLDREAREQLAGADGRVMGIYIRQGKTSRWVGVPIAGILREQIEARIAENVTLSQETGVTITHLIVNEMTRLPWTKRWFTQKFADARAKAIEDGHTSLKGLEFRDMRRTCVVRLGELGLEDALISAITGHKLESIKKILEVYMPRTTKMAARAVVARIGDARPKVDQEQQA